MRLEIAQDMQKQFDSNIDLDEDLSKLMKELPEKDQIENMIKQTKEELGLKSDQT